MLGSTFKKFRHEKTILNAVLTKNIRIYHECEGGIEKSGLRITVWHHMACRVKTKSDRVITNGNHEGQIFLSHPYANNGFLFLLTNKYRVFYFFKKNSRGSLVW